MNQSPFESSTKPLNRVFSEDHKRSIDNILRIFLSFSNLSTREYLHKSKMIHACKRREYFVSKVGTLWRMDAHTEYKTQCNERVFQICISTDTNIYRVSKYIVNVRIRAKFASSNDFFSSSNDFFSSWNDFFSSWKEQIFLPLRLNISRHRHLLMK